MGFLMCEWGARYIGLDVFTGDLSRFQFDNLYGWVHRASTSSYRIESGAKPTRYEFNASGYRDIDYQKNKPQRTKRIVVIGDSFSAATQVDLEATYWRQLQTILNKQSFYRWEVLNFGVGAYGTTQEMMTLRNECLQYEPDAIVLQIFPFNDVCDNTLGAAFLSGPQDYYRPYLDPETDYQSMTYLHPSLTSIREYSYLVRTIEPAVVKFFRKLKKYPALESEENITLHARSLLQGGKVFAQTNVSKMGREAVLLNTFARPEEQLDVIKKGWQVTEILIKRIFEIANLHGIPIVLLVIPYDAQLEPSYSTLQNKYPFFFDKSYAETRLANFSKAYNVPLLGMLEEFEQKSDLVLPYIDGHLNSKAHQFVAKKLTEKIVDLFPEPVDYEQVINFGKGSQDGHVLMTGFSLPESTHVWTEAQQAKFSFPKKGGIISSANYLFSLKGIPFAPHQLGVGQYVDFFVNGEKIARWDLPVGRAETMEFTAVVPGEKITAPPDNLEITFAFSERMSPKLLAINPDPRLLGLALVRLHVKRLEH